MSNKNKVNFMKKQRTSRTLEVLKRIFPIRKWSDFDRVRSFAFYMFNGIKKMFVPRPYKRGDRETFAAASKRLSLNEQEILKKQNALLRLSILMCVLSLAMIGYVIYNFYQHYYRAGIISFVLVLLALVLAFRYHFWYYQIKAKKLGCSFREWLNHGLLGEKHD